jgi:1,4-dihydroxy-2-naphthoyl-CoA hydrolase
MHIWKTTPDLEQLNAISENTLVALMGIRFTEIGDDHLTAVMPVDHRTRQPMGLLHGGASAVLAETLGSVGAFLTTDPETQQSVGLEINANHLRSVTGGSVTGTARPLHLGRTTQVWDIRITDDENRLVCVSRLTMAVLNR